MVALIIQCRRLENAAIINIKNLAKKFVSRYVIWFQQL